MENGPLYGGVACGLEQVIGGLQLEGALRVGEIGVGRQENTFDGLPLLPQPRDEVQPAFTGHFDVAQENIDLLPL